MVTGGKMKNIRGLLILVISLLMLSGCNEDEKQPVSTTNTEEISLDKETEKELLALTEEIFSLLKESNYEKIAEKVDSEHGVTFAFYADFGNPEGYGGEYINLTKQEISKSNDT